MTRILEIIGEGFEFTILGLGTVFVAIIGLILVVKLINRSVNGKREQAQETAAPIVKEAVPLDAILVVPNGTTEEAVSEENTEELIAVITAAVAASLNRSTHTLIVRSVRSSPAAAPIWNQASRSEQISSRL